MTPEAAAQVLRDALMLAVWLAGPLLAIGFVAGVAISVAQIATSIQDTAVGSVPRLVAFLAGLLLLLPWMLQKLMAYTSQLFGDLGRYAR